jgi:hypothetical protein
MAAKTETAKETPTRDLVDRLYKAGCRLLAKGLPILPVNDKLPCNGGGAPMRKWKSVKCDAKRLRRGLDGALNPSWSWKIKAVPESEPRIGLRMGPESGVIDIEVDSSEEEAAVAHLFRGVDRPQTVRFSSKRGWHDLYKWDDRFEKIGQGILTYKVPDVGEVKIRLGAGGKGAQSAIPPSPGREWLPGRGIEEIEPLPLPEVVIQRLLKFARRQQRARQPRTAKTPPATSCAPLEKTPLPTTDDSKRPHCSTAHQPPQQRHHTHDTATDVLSAPYVQNECTLVQAAIREAVRASVPTQFHTRHDCIFELVRRFHAVPPLRNQLTRPWLESREGRAWLSPYLKDWFDRGKHFFRGSFDECFYDFTESWDKVERPYGESLAMYFEQSRTEQLPGDVLERLGHFDDAENRLLAQLCAVRQRAAGDEPFPLDGRAVHVVTGIPHRTVASKLRTLVDTGILKRVAEGRRGKAAEYLYLPAFE